MTLELELTEGAEVTETVTRAQANKLRQEVKDLQQTLDTGYMTLAELLYRISFVNVAGDPPLPMFKQWGFDSFDAYVEQELGVPYKKAQTLRRIYWIIEVQNKGMEAGLKARLVALGWSKVRELLKQATPHNLPALVARAETCSYSALTAWLREYKAQVEEAAKVRERVPKPTASAGGGEIGASSGPDYGDADDTEDTRLDAQAPARTEPFGDFPASGDAGGEVDPASITAEVPRRLAFFLFPTQDETVRKALALAAKQTGSDKLGHQLTMICTAYLAEHEYGNSDKTEESKVAFLEGIGETLGLDLIAVDAQGEIVFGHKAISNLEGKWKK